MSRSVVVPILGNEGWIVDPTRQLNVTFAHSLVSDKFQSVNYKGKITSLMDIIVQYQYDPEEMVDAIEAMYKVYYKKFYDQVDVNAIYTMNPDNTYQVSISLVVTKNGINYSLAYTGAMDQSTLTNTVRGLT